MLSGNRPSVRGVYRQQVSGPRGPIAARVKCPLALTVALLLPWLAPASAAAAAGASEDEDVKSGHISSTVQLPAPATRGRISVEEALAARRSVREFEPEPLDLRQLSQLLWSMQGITHPGGLRTAPSAGALYPLEVYVVTATGLHHYEPRGHRLSVRSDRDLRRALARAALGQECVARAPAVFVIAAVRARTEAKYGPARSPRYVDMEAGHSAQNLLLQATALGLGGVPVGAFEDDGVQAALGLPRDHRPLYLVPVGKPRPSRTGR